MSFVDIFPTELIEKVLSYLSIQDLLNASKVCVSWHEASNNGRIWRIAIKKSTTRECMSVLRDMDKFNGVASNFDENHCFKSEIPSTSRLSAINPWKLSLLQNNFVKRNWRGHHTMVARHQISIPDSYTQILKMEVVYRSKSPKDCLYFPILVGNPNQAKKNFFLIRLDGIPGIVKYLFTTVNQIPIACIDRDCLVWVQNQKVKCLVLVDNISSSQIQNVGNLFSDSENEGDWCYSNCEEWKFSLTMDADNIVAGFKFDCIKIWCRKTYQLKSTFLAPGNTSQDCISYCRLYNGRFYFSLWQDGMRETDVRIYDINEDSIISSFPIGSKVYRIVCSDKYYVIVSSSIAKSLSRISVHDMETNATKITVDVALNFSARRVWIVDDNILFLVKSRLEIMSSITFEIRFGMRLSFNDQNFRLPREFRYPYMPLGPRYEPTHRKFDIWDSFLLVKECNKVEIYDWKLGLKLQELMLDIADDIVPEHKFRVINDETRLVAISKSVINVIGFW